jgi:hypothetical protein
VSLVENNRGSNRAIADQLHDVRESIRELQYREAKLRLYLIRNPHDRYGSEYHAVIRPMSRRQVDVKSLAIEIGQEVLQRHTRVQSVDPVWLTTVGGPARSEAPPWKRRRAG